MTVSFFSRTAFMAALVAVSIAFEPTNLLAKDAPVSAMKTSATETYELLNLFGDVFDRVRSDYVEETKDSDLIEAAINGMLTSLDPHSGYLNEKNFGEMQVQTKGEFGGLGIEVTMENGLVKVVSPIDDTPAFKAGIQAGDYISGIGKEQVFGLTLSDAVEMMRGPVGTDILLTVLREGQKEPLKITVTRDLIKIKSIRFHAEKDVGYVRITSFSEQTSENLVTAIRSLQGEIKGMKGLVLDLRNNPGGLLDQAIGVADTFLEQGEIVSTRDRNPDDTQRFTAEAGDILNGLPIVVLINQGSASASEIVAGALKDHGRAVVMGTKSFGKGSVQTVIPLKNHGAMRLTTSRYYTPSGTSIQAKGIEPDIEVKTAKVQAIDLGIANSEADLRGRLINEQVKAVTSGTEKSTLPFPVDPKAKKTKDSDLPLMGVSAEEDYQLGRALDLIRGLSIFKISQGAELKAAVK
jgi:carboxyl-terminal processing protease